jgi:hypothetical protein
METTNHSVTDEDDRLAQLKREVLNLRPVSPLFMYAGIFCISVASACSIFRYHYGMSYEEAPMWWHLGFWGGYLLSTAFSITSMVLNRRLGRRLARTLHEIKEEKARRAVPEQQAKEDLQSLEKHAT